MPHRDYGAITSDTLRQHWLEQDGFARHGGGGRPVGQDDRVDLVMGRYGSWNNLNIRAGDLVWFTSDNNRHAGIYAWRLHIPNDHFEGNVPTPPAPPLREWRNPMREFISQPILPEPAQAAPVVGPRAFDCPSDHNQCQRGDCTVMHCMAQHELRMRTPAKRPSRPLPPERTLGEWYVAHNRFVNSRLPSGNTVQVADCQAYGAEEERTLAVAQRIALLPRLEAVIRDLNAYYNTGVDRGSRDSSGYIVRPSHEWQTEISELFRTINTPYRNGDE